MKNYDFSLFFNLSKQEKKSLLLGLFVTCVILSNILGSKTTYISIFDFTISFSVAILTVPFFFIIIDSIVEVFGKKEALRFSTFGLFSMIIAIFIISFSVLAPPTDRFNFNVVKDGIEMPFTYNQAYNVSFSSSLRMSIASITSFALSQFINILIFDFLKRISKNKFLWFRNNISNFFGKFLDTVLFMFLALYKLTPQYTALFLIELIIPWWIIKVFAGSLFTPFVYIIVNWLKK